jgi:hypothetical protein
MVPVLAMYLNVSGWGWRRWRSPLFAFSVAEAAGDRARGRLAPGTDRRMELARIGRIGPGRSVRTR